LFRANLRRHVPGTETKALEEIPGPARTRPLLNLDRTFATPGALEALADAHESGAWYLRRHQCGDWADIDARDWAPNDIALREGTRILSAYQPGTGEKLWIIAEWDRAVTTLLFWRTTDPPLLGPAS
jgi:hypothetical protein